MKRKDARSLIGIGILAIALSGFLSIRPRTCLNFAHELNCVGGFTTMAETTCDACPERRPEVLAAVAGAALGLVGAGGLALHALKRRLP